MFQQQQQQQQQYKIQLPNSTNSYSTSDILILENIKEKKKATC